MAEGVGTFVLLVVLVLAVGTDIKTRRVSNGLIVAGIASGFTIASLAGWQAVGTAALGLVTGLLVLLPAYVWASMGAGDVKLMATAGVFLGPGNTIFAFLATLVAGALFGLAVIMVRDGGKDIVRRYHGMLKYLISTGRWSYVGPEDGEAAAARIPYAVAIACGVVLVLWYSGGFAQLAGAARALTS